MHTFGGKYASGREADWFVVGFPPRKQSLTLYGMPGYEQHDELRKTLAKHKTGKPCLYIKHPSADAGEA